VRQERIDAGLGRGRIEDELRFAVLLQDSVVATHHNRAIGIAAGDHTQTEEPQVHEKRQQRSPEKKENEAQENSPEPLSEDRRRKCHEARL